MFSPESGIDIKESFNPLVQLDMIYFKFSRAILEGKRIDIYNHGHMQGDFTYINDIIDGILRVMIKPPQLNSDLPAPNSVTPAPNKVIPEPNNVIPAQAGIKPSDTKITNAEAPYKTYNIGNKQPLTLRHFITTIENACGKKAIESSLPMQAGDVPITYADIDSLSADTGFKPTTSIDNGIKFFLEWYRCQYLNAC